MSGWIADLTSKLEVDDDDMVNFELNFILGEVVIYTDEASTPASCSKHVQHMDHARPDVNEVTARPASRKATKLNTRLCRELCWIVVDHCLFQQVSDLTDDPGFSSTAPPVPFRSHRFLLAQPGNTCRVRQRGRSLSLVVGNLGSSLAGNNNNW